MATRGVKPQQAGQLCDYCHQKPKFSNHRYCSKTCASQAGPGANVSVNNNMCTQCGKKPKFQGFDFCGKSCAAAAPPQGRNGTGTAQRSKGNNSSNNQQPGFNPAQVAQFVAQSVPQVKAFLAALNSAAAPQTAPQQLQQVPLAPAPQVVAPQNNPFLQPQAPVPMNGTPAASSSLLFGTQPQPVSAQPAAADNTECLIPGCGKPVHVDSKGIKTSDYCSQRHREEAVSSGVAEPCILCLQMPQSEKDYFCSRACREEAMEKLPE
ncbi:hypothetical protein FPV67DRAFT_925883 [Lyophyllum atratum]|nr:hypothetical protein FPV67DRAFT_925883 [Lyophyllum atratum]